MVAPISVNRYKLVEFDACNSGSERVELVYNNIPEESTTVDRYAGVGLLCRCPPLFQTVAH